MATITFIPGTTSYTGSSGSDTLLFNTTDADIAGGTLTSIEILKAGLSSSTTFSLSASVPLTSLTQIQGNKGNADTLAYSDLNFNLSHTTLSSIEVLKATLATFNTTFTLDQADLASNGSVIGNASFKGIIAAAGATLNLTSTTLTDIAVLSTQFAKGTSGTTFTIDGTDLTGLSNFSGSNGADTLIVTADTINASSATFISLETLKAGSANATDFKISAAALHGNAGSLTAIAGTAKNDTLEVVGASFDLRNTTLSSIEILQAVTNKTTFALDQGDLAKGGSVVGSGQDDTILAGGSALDLTSTGLSSIEILKAAVGGTAFTLKADQFASLDEINGDTGTDTLILKTAAFDVTGGPTLDGIEVLKAGLATSTLFTLDRIQLPGSGDVNQITGGAGVDTLTIKDPDFDLSSVGLTSVEKLTAGADSTNFTLNQGDLAAKGTITGSTGTSDSITAASTNLDLSQTTLVGVEFLNAGSTSDTTLTLNAAELKSLIMIGGNSGDDTLAFAGTGFDLTTAAQISGFEHLQAGLATATTFTVDSQLIVGIGTEIKSIIGGKGIDILVVKDLNFDLTQVTLSSVEKLTAGTTGNQPTVFTLDNDDLAFKGTITGTANVDEIHTIDTELDLSNTTLVSVEKLVAMAGADTVFTLAAAQLKGLAIDGSGGGIDALALATTAIDVSALPSTSLTSIEELRAGTTGATSFTVAVSQLAGEFQFITGTDLNDTLIVKGTDFNLTSVALDSVEILKASGNVATTFTVDADDLAEGGSVVGGTGKDVLTTLQDSLDLSRTKLSSIEVLRADGTAGTTFLVDQADLASGGSVIGVTGQNDTLAVFGTQIDLTHTTLSSIERLEAGTASPTHFILDAADFLSVGSIVGGKSLGDMVVVAATALDLSITTLSGIETLRTEGTSCAISFGTGDAVKGLTIDGEATHNTLTYYGGLVLDLTSTTLVNVEFLRMTAPTATLTVDQSDLAYGGSVVMFSGGSLLVNDDVIDLSHTTLTDVTRVASTVAAGANGVTMIIGAMQDRLFTDQHHTGKVDTYAFTSSYKITDPSSSTGIFKHMFEISYFEHGTGGDVLDLHNVTKGTGTFENIQATIDAANPLTLTDALDIAAQAQVGKNAHVVEFQFGSEDYVVVDNSASTKLSANDAVIGLVGNHVLSAADNLIL